jgi:hypothetical protein
VLRELESARLSAQTASSPALLKLYVLVVMVLLPMDWFAPTGALFKEFGAKPATLVLTLGGLCGIAFVNVRRSSRNSVEFVALIVFAAWMALGFLAVLANFMMGWSDWHSDRSPFVQLFTQSGLVVACAIAVVGNARLMASFPVATLAARYLPAAVLVHLIMFGLEAARVLDANAPPLVLFRAVEQHEGHRITGVFSEPSMFGTFAALYGTALLSLEVRHGRKLLYALMAIALFASSIWIGAKTFVVVVGVQAAYFVLRRTRSLATGIAAVGALTAVVACGVFFIQYYSTLDVRENLSSADRLGSALLASNVIAHGYGLPGIGFGQFHFFYRAQFAPDFLYLSREASQQLNPDAANRASTYNFYLRVLLETGLTGFIVLVLALKKLWSVELSGRLAWIPYIFAGALGFLMTQDTYVYPPLMFSSALIMSVLESRRCVVAGAAGHDLAVV